MNDETCFPRLAGPTDENPPFRFAAAVRVGFSETDAQGIVYYGRYPPYFDMARVEYFRHLNLIGLDDASAGMPGEIVMRSLEIGYHASAVFDDVLDVFCRVRKIGNSSVRFDFEVHKADPDGPGKLLAEAAQTMVYVDPQRRRPMRIPDNVRAIIAQFEGDSCEIA